MRGTATRALATGAVRCLCACGSHSAAGVWPRRRGGSRLETPATLLPQEQCKLMMTGCSLRPCERHASWCSCAPTSGLGGLSVCRMRCAAHASITLMLCLSQTHPPASPCLVWGDPPESEHDTSIPFCTRDAVCAARCVDSVTHCVSFRLAGFASKAWHVVPRARVHAFDCSIR